MNKNITKAIITICSIIVAFLLINFLNNNSLEDSGTIRIIVIDQKKTEVINKEIAFGENQNLKIILETNFDIEEQNGFLVRINDVYADGKDYFIKIYINDKAALQGINQLKFQDGDIISFVYTKVGSINVPS